MWSPIGYSSKVCSPLLTVEIEYVLYVKSGG